MTLQEAEAIAKNPETYPLSKLVTAKQLIESDARRKSK